MKINFKQIKKYSSPKRDKFVLVDIREVLADRIFNETGSGIADLRLSEKIYDSDENTEFSELEVERIKIHVAQVLPWLLAGLEDYLELKEENR